MDGDDAMDRGIERMTIESFWTPAGIAAVTGGRWLVEPSESDLGTQLPGLSTDSRRVRPGELFVALKGERFDAHDFLAEVLRAGPGVVVVEREVLPIAASDAPGDRASSGLHSPIGHRPSAILHVPSTLAALQRMAGVYREVLGRAGCRVIAVGGSNGKTTTRDLIHTVLSVERAGWQSPGSFNNHIGVPLTLLGYRPPPGRGSFLVVEIGTNHPGEVESLASMVRPDAAVITSIGHEHMEFFGTIEGVAREEAGLLRHVRPGGAVMVQAGAWERVRPFAAVPEGVRPVVYGLEDAGGAERAMLGELSLLGRHNRENALAAIAAGRWMGMADASIAAGLRRARPVRMRLERSVLGSVTLINDGYNANPDSVREALRVLRELPVAEGGVRTAVLGDMFELGPEGPELHRGIGRELASMGDAIGRAVLIGRLSMFTAEALLRSWPSERAHVFAAWSDDLPGQVAALIGEGDVVLIKGSRGMRLERLIPAMAARFGSGGGGDAAVGAG